MTRPRLSHPRSLHKKSLLWRRKQLLRKSQQLLRRKFHQLRTKSGTNASSLHPPHGLLLHQGQVLHQDQDRLLQALPMGHSHQKIPKNARPRREPKRSGSFLPRKRYFWKRKHSKNAPNLPSKRRMPRKQRGSPPSTSIICRTN